MARRRWRTGRQSQEIKSKSKVHELGLDESVVFTGVRTDVNRLMQGMDLFILPSLFEGFPMTMIEAQSAGLPCMISDKCRRNAM